MKIICNYSDITQSSIFIPNLLPSSPQFLLANVGNIVLIIEHKTYILINLVVRLIDFFTIESNIILFMYNQTVTLIPPN
jgi:hypothetical protein